MVSVLGHLLIHYRYIYEITEISYSFLREIWQRGLLVHLITWKKRKRNACIMYNQYILHNVKKQILER